MLLWPKDLNFESKLWYSVVDRGLRPHTENPFRENYSGSDQKHRVLGVGSPIDVTGAEMVEIAYRDPGG